MPDKPNKPPRRRGSGPLTGAKIAGAVGSVGRAVERTWHHARLGELLRLPGTTRQPGAPPGIEPAHLKDRPKPAEPVRITCIDYAPQQVQTHQIQPAELDPFLQATRPDWCEVRWINVDGLGDSQVINTLARWYRLHPLAVEDLLNIPQRPKAEPYGGEGEYRARLFIVGRMVQLLEHRLVGEQVSLFLGRHTVLTFQQTHGDVWNPIRQRINKTGSRLRTNDASFLVYALLDALVDHFFPILEQYGEQLEQLESRILDHPDQRQIHDVHAVKRELLLLRREIWPMREMIQSLLREPHECMSENTGLYLRDVYDHAVQIIDFIETCREMASSLSDTYMTAMGNHMNQVMKVLTIIATIFIPITFLAGVYGMNFKYIPELDWPYAYPVFWGICLFIFVGLLALFRRKKWL
jgi:magnesium transporter